MPKDDKKEPAPKPQAGEFRSAFDAKPRSPRTSSDVSIAAPPKQKPRMLPQYSRRAPMPVKSKKPAAPQVMTTHQKQQLGSGFIDSSKSLRRQTAIGSNPLLFKETEEEAAQNALVYDGVTAPPELTGRDTWKALQAPRQSRPGKRSKTLYEQVLKQFAVAYNPRYAPDAIEKDRAHLFAWDVSLAMNCEIPHFAGAKQHNLAQTTDWVRHEGPMRGWTRVNVMHVIETANLGQLVVAIPKDLRLKGLAVVQPQSPAALPTVVSAGPRRGWGLSLKEALGVMACEYFTHV